MLLNLNIKNAIVITESNHKYRYKKNIKND